MQSRYNPWPDEENVGRAQSWRPMAIFILAVIAVVAALVIGVERERSRSEAATVTAPVH